VSVTDRDISFSAVKKVGGIKKNIYSLIPVMSYCKKGKDIPVTGRAGL
jgi:hypothetical protein